ncbi:MAG TPA: transporter, partial [Candidatus Didemnitutus sp.]|nr:transporter [Candidatus Didemnitutus sp.]
GFLDPRFRVAINFYGAPALELKDFANYKPGLVFGASFQVTPPLGQYDSTKVINLGTNRWTFDPDIGFSKKIGHVTFDATIGATIVTENHDYYNGQTLAQDPIYSSQFNLSYDFGRGIWAALGYTYYWGGQTSINGAAKNTELSNSRAGLTVALPINRNYSLKFNYSSGVTTRVGSSFNTLSVGLQYRWGGGL